MNFPPHPKTTQGAAVPTHLRDAFLLSQEAIVLWTPGQADACWCNPAAEVLLGVSASDLAARGLALVTDEPDALPGCHRLLFRRGDGTHLPCDVTAWPVHPMASGDALHALMLRPVREGARLSRILRALDAISAQDETAGADKLDAILALGCREFDLPAGVVGLIRDQRFTVLAAHAPGFTITPGDQFDLDQTFCRYTQMKRTCLAVLDAATRPAQLQDPYPGSGMRSYLGVPLVVGGARNGTLSFCGPDPRDGFSETDRDIARLLSAWVSQELGRRRIYADLADRMTRDWLTGARGRRSFNIDLETANRGSNAAHLVLMDLDYFKSINDRFGHDAGDDVLRAFAETVTRLLPANTPLYRVGGEEFAVILTGYSNAAADILAERLRDGIADTVFPCRGSDVSVTVSIGVSARPEGAGTVADWYRAADQAMYGAKNAGRNRVQPHMPRAARA